MDSVDSLISQLENLDRRLRFAAKAEAGEVLPALFTTLDRTFEAYMRAPLDARIDIHLTFDCRPALLGALTDYMEDLLTRIHQTQRKRPLLTWGLVAESMLLGRVIPERHREARQDLVRVAEANGYNTRAAAQTMRLGSADFARRALIFHRDQKRQMAAKAMGRALALNEALANDMRAVKLAVDITGREDGVALLLDDRRRLDFVTHLEPLARTLSRRPVTPPPPLDTVGLALGLGIAAALALIFTLVGGVLVGTGEDTGRSPITNFLTEEAWFMGLVLGTAMLVPGVIVAIRRKLVLRLSEAAPITLVRAPALVVAIGLITGGLAAYGMLALDYFDVPLPVSESTMLKLLFGACSLGLASLAAGIAVLLLRRGK